MDALHRKTRGARKGRNTVVRWCKKNSLYRYRWLRHERHCQSHARYGVYGLGSDAQRSAVTQKLEQAGAVVDIGHSYDNIGDTQAVVVSTAIPESNPEVKAAHDKKIPVYHRSDVLATLMGKQLGIAVAGAHGKTTTTSIIALMLEKAAMDPTIIIGGELESIGGSAKLGQGTYIVAEADESDGSFLKLSPHIAVVTNIENDHMDYYKTMDNILRTFEEFLHKLEPADGLAVLCFDSDYVRDMASKLDRRYVSYALDHPADYTARNIKSDGPMTSFDVYYHDEFWGMIRICVPGKHNVANALAAVAVGVETGLSFRKLPIALTSFKGPSAAFSPKGGSMVFGSSMIMRTTQPKLPQHFWAHAKQGPSG